MSTETETTTNQTCLAAFAATHAAREAALARIMAILEPAARAVDASRTPASGYFLEETCTIENLKISMTVRSMGKDGRVIDRPFDSAGPRWSTQIIGADQASPETLLEVERIARIWAADIDRTYRARVAAEVQRLREEAAAFDQIARS